MGKQEDKQNAESENLIRKRHSFQVSTERIAFLAFQKHHFDLA
jgi:hypothetical protein